MRTYLKLIGREQVNLILCSCTYTSFIILKKRVKTVAIRHRFLSAVAHEVCSPSAFNFASQVLCWSSGCLLLSQEAQNLCKTLGKKCHPSNPRILPPHHKSLKKTVLQNLSKETSENAFSFLKSVQTLKNQTSKPALDKLTNGLPTLHPSQISPFFAFPLFKRSLLLFSLHFFLIFF